VKRVVLASVFFIILCQTSSGENTVDFKDVYLNWQFFNYAKEQGLSFMNLNPVFFGSSGGFSFKNIFENTGQNNTQSERTGNRISKEREHSLLKGIIFITGSIFRDTYLNGNRQAQNIYNDALRQFKRQ
jgi:hypothetical protein